MKFPELNRAERDLQQYLLEHQNLETLQIRHQTIRVLPRAIEWLENLKEIEIYRCPNFKLFPEEITELPHLQSIKIIQSGFKKIPAFFGAFPKLESLHLIECELVASSNWIALSKIASLKDLSLQQSLRNLDTLPIAITKIKNLQHLSISDNLLQQLPPEIQMLKQLIILKCGGNRFSKFPNILAKLPNLKQLYISARNLNDFPNALLKFPKETRILPTGKRTSQYPNVAIIERFLKYAQQQAFTKKYMQFIWKILQEKTLLKNIQTLELITILDSGIESLMKAALHELNARIQSTTALKKGNQIVIKGNIGSKIGTLKSRTKSHGIKIGTKSTSTTTHILLGTNPQISLPKLKEKNIQYITEPFLIEWLNQQQQPFLLEKSSQTTTQFENIQALLHSRIEENIQIALSILETGGLPKPLFTSLFLLYKTGTTPTIRKRILRITQQYMPPETTALLKRRLAISGHWVEEKTITKNLCFYREKLPILNGLEMATFLYQHFKKGWTFGIFELSPTEQAIFIEQSLAPDGMLVLMNKKLKKLPEGLTLCTKVTHLNVAQNHFKTIPPIIFKMPNLKELIIYNLFQLEDRIFPQAALKHPKLQKIYIDHNLQNIPSITTATQHNLEIQVRKQ